MTFLTEIKKPFSEKFSLVRIEPYRKLDVVSVGGGLYTITTDLNVSKVYINGSPLTLVSAISDVNQYAFNPLTNTVLMKLSSPATIAIVFHSVYLTVGKNRAIGRNPLLPTTDFVEWRGVLVSEPTFDESLDNINSGIVTISTSSIEIYNNLGEFDYLFSRIDGVFNCYFDVWFCCNGQSIYAWSGILTSCNQNKNTITISTSNILERLNKICSLSWDTRYSYLDPAIFANAAPNQQGYVIPSLLGRCSDFKLHYAGSPLASVRIDPMSLRQALCTSYSNTISTTTNRTWVTHRCLYAGAFSGARTHTHVGSSYTFNMSTSLEAKKFIQEDTFRANGSIFEVTSVSGSSVNATLISGAAPASPATITMYEVPVVYVSDGDTFRKVSCEHYAVTSGQYDGGENNIFEITFNDNFEAAIGMAALDPNMHEVRFRASNFNNRIFNHYQVAEKILGFSGIRYNFTAPSNPTEVSFMIPLINEEYGSFLSYIEILCTSNAAYIKQIADGYYSYDMFSVPSNPTEVTEDDYLFGSLSIDEEPKDICSKLIIEPIAAISLNNNFTFQSNDIAASIGGAVQKTIKTINYPVSIRNEQVLQNMFKTNFYRFKLKNLGYDWTIGKSITINGKDLIVIGIGKSLNELSITAVDTFTE